VDIRKEKEKNKKKISGIKKAIHTCRITCERSESARERRIYIYESDQQRTSPLSGLVARFAGTGTLSVDGVINKTCSLPELSPVSMALNVLLMIIVAMDDTLTNSSPSSPSLKVWKNMKSPYIGICREG